MARSSAQGGADTQGETQMARGCANCGLPIARQRRRWTHVGDWQGVRCHGRLTGAVPVRTARSSQVAARLGLSSASVQRYAREGAIPFTKTPGGHYRFELDEVLEVLGD